MSRAVSSPQERVRFPTRRDAAGTDHFGHAGDPGTRRAGAARRPRAGRPGTDGDPRWEDAYPGKEAVGAPGAACEGAPPGGCTIEHGRGRGAAVNSGEGNKV